jgi:hypothetical protein
MIWDPLLVIAGVVAWTGICVWAIRALRRVRLHQGWHACESCARAVHPMDVEIVILSDDDGPEPFSLCGDCEELTRPGGAL